MCNKVVRRDQKLKGVGTVGYREFTFGSCTGEELFARAWEVEGTPLAKIVIVHGLGEHCGRYQAFAEFLQGQGYSVYAYDYLGFGKSPGKRGHIESFDIYFHDLQQFINTIRTDAVKTVLLGHSLGGLLALAYGLKFPSTIDALAITSPGLRNNPLPWYLVPIVKLFSKILPGKQMNNRVIPEKLSHDQEVCRKYVEDPLVHFWVTPHFFDEVMKTMEYATANAVKMAKPLLLLYAGDDYLVNIEGTREFVRNLPPFLAKEIACYGTMYHEILNEQGKEQVWERIDKWLKATLEKLNEQQPTSE